MRFLKEFVRAHYPPNDMVIDPFERHVLQLWQLKDAFRLCGVGMLIAVVIFAWELMGG